MARLQFIRSRYQQSPFSNPWLLAAVASSLLLQGLVLYTPVNRFFRVDPPELVQWGGIVAAVVMFILLSTGMYVLHSRFFESSSIPFAKEQP